MTERNPRFSIIVPVYKVEPYLRRCVDSVLSQTFKDFEVLLVDDGSPDRCGEICDEYGQADARVKVIHRTNGGLSAARNSGLDVASGEWIWFIDSDDYVEPWSLATLNAAMRPELDVLSFGRYKENLDGLTLWRSDFPCDNFEAKDRRDQAIFIVQKLLCYCYGWESWGRVFRRSTIERAGLRFADNNKVFAEDMYFFVCFMMAAKWHACIEDRLYHYVVRSDSIMGLHDFSRIDRVMNLYRAIESFALLHRWQVGLERVLPLICYLLFKQELSMSKGWQGIGSISTAERDELVRLLRSAHYSLSGLFFMKARCFLDMNAIISRTLDDRLCYFIDCCLIKLYSITVSARKRFCAGVMRHS